MSYPVVLGVHALLAPPLKDSQQARITLGLQPLIARFFNTLIKQPAMALQLFLELRILGQVANLVRVAGQVVQFLRLFFRTEEN